MCGIALIASGIRLHCSSLFSDFIISSDEADQLLFTIDDIKTALKRRGPDSLGSKEFSFHLKDFTSLEGEDRLALVQSGESDNKLDNGFDRPKAIAEFCFVGATLQLRGVNPVTQPLTDADENILVYNGEIFGGIYVGDAENDTEILMQSLAKCCSCTSEEHTKLCLDTKKGKCSVPECLSTIKGPWAIIYWQAGSRILWFGRDAFGRRSLLVKWPTSQDMRFILSSVSPASHNESGLGELTLWEELPCGIYSAHISAPNDGEFVDGEVIKHEWPNPLLNDLLKWDRKCVQPSPDELSASRIRKQCMLSAHSTTIASDEGCIQASVVMPAETVLLALKAAVMRRSAINVISKGKCDINGRNAPVAVLFSGGLDSMILAALLDQCIEKKYDIDLLNVSFDNESAPDRISARAGLKELRKISPLRRWKLVEIDGKLSTLSLESKHVMSLINPSKTYMDLNIGLALWLAAGGNGWLCEGGSSIDAAACIDEDDRNCGRISYKSQARVLLVGAGADEQCAGYGRHRTKYRTGSWVGLHEEMKLDVQRIWKRNLGRDDRCIADNGKEARFPFLDEEVISTLLNIPLWEIADLDLPSGRGDKKILRHVAELLGIHEAAVLPKRAIQFGSRIARESNVKNFGSNRAANQASAGSVEIPIPK
ncbi:asparagine synthetase domain-containing protein 1 isoform X2 [Impatiens glandulifera]|uniref:asparagine synthetase domain-containing protein 1 isoform X2 n=1 Tax=Impatiens glandulifera TaxID=253017 RepID=UPI001FB0B18C|nr:asparagine synthetase domain-containing protein 1 isoform X2 [Impatiens glandulifera]